MDSREPVRNMIGMLTAVRGQCSYDKAGAKAAISSHRHSCIKKVSDAAWEKLNETEIYWGRKEPE